MTEIAPKARSYADPTGNVYQVHDKYVRSISEDTAIWIKQLVGTNFYTSATASGFVPELRLEPTSKGGWQVETIGIAPLTYPWEWSPLQLADAGLQTINLAIDAIKNGIILKDAQAKNVVYKHGAPIFVDYASFAPYSGGRVWNGRGQFDRHFILPLLAYLHRGVLPSNSLRIGPDGLDPLTAARLLGLRRWAGRAEIEACALPCLSTRPDSVLKQPKPRSDSSPIDVEIYSSLLRHARNLLISVRARVQRSQQGRWGNYGDGAFHYGDAELEQKKNWLAKKLVAIAPQQVMDLGANTGTFSKLCASLGASVTAIESDVDAMSRLYEEVAAAKLPVTPVLMDVCAPTSGNGWLENEFAGFAERFHGTVDLVLALAVIHHIVVRGYSYQPFISLLSKTTRRYVVVEYVDPDDEMFSNMLSGRNLDPDRFRLKSFTTAFDEHFKVLEQVPLKSGKRVLFLGELRDASNQ